LITTKYVELKAVEDTSYSGFNRYEKNETQYNGKMDTFSFFSSTLKLTLTYSLGRVLVALVLVALVLVAQAPDTM